MDEFQPGGRLDGDINPYTGEAIVKLNANSWAEASPVELYKQLTVLENRLQIAHTLGKVEIIQQLVGAIAHLRSSINEAMIRDSKRPIRKRPNTPDQRRNDQSSGSDRPDFT